MAAQHFSAIIVGGAERPNGFQVFLQSYESREGKGFKTTWTWLWDIKDRITTEYVLSLEWLEVMAATGVYTCKGNDQISIFIEQTSKMTSLNVRLPGPCFIFRSHNLVSECRINQSQRLLINSEFGTLSSEGEFLGFPRCPSPYCLRRSLVVCNRSRSPLCPDRFNSSSGGIRSHTLPQDKQEPAWMWPRCLSYSPMATECFGSKIQLMLVQQYSESDSVQWEETSKSLIYYSESEELYEARRFVTERMGPAAGKSL